MIKYTRSIQKLSDCIKDIFDTDAISIDSKAIVLVLAATMPINKFSAFIDSVDKLSAISLKLKEINAIRIKYGDLYRDYIIAATLHALSYPVNSDELQQFIREGKAAHYQELSQALSTESLKSEVNEESFSSAIHKAAAHLIKKINIDKQHSINTITEAYLHCRSEEKPITSYYAVVYAIAHILEIGGLDPKNSLAYSYKLAGHALKHFIHDDSNKNTILTVFAAQSEVGS